MKVKPLSLFQWALIPVFDTTNQVCMKFLGMHIGQIGFGLEWLSRAVSSPFLWLAFASDIGNFITWMLILKRSNLSFASPVASIGYVTISMVAWFFFKEELYIRQVIGLALIMFGVLLIGWNEKEIKKSVA